MTEKPQGQTKVKPNLKALRRLRAVFAKVPADRVHMRTLTDKAPCGTVHCLLGWGTTDPQLQAQGLVLIPNNFFRGAISYQRTLTNAAAVLGLSLKTAQSLFAYDMSDAAMCMLERDEHAVKKTQVLRQLDRVIGGKPIRPYRVKSARATRP